MRSIIASLALLLPLCACGGNRNAHDEATTPPPVSDEDSTVQTPPPVPEPTPNSAADADPIPTPEPPQGLELDPGAVDPRTLSTAATTSIGSASNGTLEGGIRLPKSGPGFRYNPKKRDQARYGVVELINAVIAASAAVDRELPGSQALIGELSLAKGGPLSGHGSHQAGRDVDVLFYLLDADGQPFESMAIPLDPSGAGTEYGDLQDPSDDRPVTLDLARTWRFIQAMVEDKDAAVQRIFVVEHLRTLLLEEAARAGASAATIQRFGELACQPGFPHDDHLHIRVFCSPDDIDRGCTDTAPIYPWRRKALAASGRSAKKPGPRKKGSRPKLTSHAAARAKAGPMHQDVIDFLDRRRAWVKKPHPGRPYCR